MSTTEVSVWASAFAAITVACLAYLLIGVEAVTYVAYGYLIYVVLWVCRQLYLEYWEWLRCEYQRHKAFREVKNRRML